MSDSEDLPRKQIDGERHYLVDGAPYPSVTTVCSRHPRKKRSLSKWEDRVGSAEADRIRDETALMGTVAHHRILNQYAIRQLPKPEVDMSNAYDGIIADVEACIAMWEDLDFEIEPMPEVEARIVSHEYQYAGTFDLLTDGTVVDLKTSKAIRESHRWQIAAYHQAVNELDDMPDAEDAAIIRLDPRPESNPSLTAEVERLDAGQLAHHFDTFADLLSETEG